MSRLTVSHKDLEKLSSYLDRQLSQPERARLEARLKQDANLQTALESLEQTQRLLKRAKTLPVPRSFTLTSEMAQQIRPARRGFAIPALSFSSLAAILVMVFAILFEVYPSTNLARIAGNEPQMEYAMEADETMPMMAEEAMPEMEMLEAAPAARTFNEAPPIINWNDDGSNAAVESAPYGLGGVGGAGMLEEPAEAYPVEPVGEPALDMPPGVGGMGGGGEAPEAAAQPTEAPNEEKGPMPKSAPEAITGTGPILGLRPGEEAAVYNDTVLEILEEEAAAYQAVENRIPSIRFIQIGAALIAILTGLAAFWMYRKNRL